MTQICILWCFNKTRQSFQTKVPIILLIIPLQVPHQPNLFSPVPPLNPICTILFLVHLKTAPIHQVGVLFVFFWFTCSSQYLKCTHGREVYVWSVHKLRTSNPYTAVKFYSLDYKQKVYNIKNIWNKFPISNHLSRKKKKHHCYRSMGHCLNFYWSLAPALACTHWACSTVSTLTIYVQSWRLSMLLCWVYA